jgi:hypothetical protein
VGSLETETQQAKTAFVSQHENTVKSLRTQLQALDAELKRIAEIAPPVQSADTMNSVDLPEQPRKMQRSRKLRSSKQASATLRDGQNL